MKQANFLYFYIACLVCGSILGMNRKILIQGLFRMIIPMLLGMVCAMGVGTLVGVILGLDWQHTLFYVVTPVLAGGIGEGILPLSLGYSAITGVGSEQLVAQLIPATIIGNFFAILCTALLNRFGEKHPSYSGQGQLVKIGHSENMSDALKDNSGALDVKLMGARSFNSLFTFYCRWLVTAFNRFSRTGVDDYLGGLLEIPECYPPRNTKWCQTTL